MLFQIGLAVAVVLLIAALMKKRFGSREDRPIDTGTVSDSWLAELRVGKRDSPWN